MRLLKRLFGGTPRLSSASSQSDLQVPSPSIDPSDFRPFRRDLPADYLCFLGMGSSDVQPALSSLSHVLRSTAAGRRYIELRFQGRDWRPHLVATVAVLLSPDRASYAPTLWRTFDYGSWVAPQLAVALYLSDPEFGREARHRIVGRCPVPTAPDLDPLFERQIRSKNMASLLRMVSRLPSETWVAPELEKADVRALVEADVDSVGEFQDSGRIADSWLAAVQIQFAKFGCYLSPAGSNDQ